MKFIFNSQPAIIKLMLLIIVKLFLVIGRNNLFALLDTWKTWNWGKEKSWKNLVIMYFSAYNYFIIINYSILIVISGVMR